MASDTGAILPRRGDVSVSALFAEHLDAVTEQPVRLRARVTLLHSFDVAEPTTRRTVAALPGRPADAPTWPW
ncbi:hypothetical protein E4P41_17385 [Geodermatophilus sp. DF01-2]|uniref:hypothetical protein n=1 Tax=Geodermatophilus sp. DF01-2 TaxID=2559610 RepID=UPI00107360CD|nr:hypothetical protein [Geodermatophilus sp. DF01_2]TFV55289.1 hypothetical protein E4P41_17385 [Geodermatophilus sp. DF01_2]